METLKARLGENSTYLGMAVLAFVGGRYGPDVAEQLSNFVALGLGLVVTFRADKSPE